jgi:hypothetical protein
MRRHLRHLHRAGLPHPLLGGLLADRVLGYTQEHLPRRHADGLGYITLACRASAPSTSRLALIILGNGFFKPNISTLLGNLYNDDAVPGPQGQRLQHLLHGHQHRCLRLQPVRGLHAEQLRLGRCLRHGGRGHVHRPHRVRHRSEALPPRGREEARAEGGHGPVSGCSPRCSCRPSSWASARGRSRATCSAATARTPSSSPPSR